MNAECGMRNAESRKARPDRFAELPDTYWNAAQLVSDVHAVQATGRWVAEYQRRPFDFWSISGNPVTALRFLALKLFKAGVRL